MTYDFTSSKGSNSDSNSDSNSGSNSVSKRFIDKLIEAVSVDDLGDFTKNNVDGNIYKLNYKDNTSLYRFVANSDITQDALFSDSQCTNLIVKRIP